MAAAVDVRRQQLALLPTAAVLTAVEIPVELATQDPHA